MIFEAFLSTPQMQAVFGETPVMQAMLDFESALARAEAAEGVIPQAAADVIASCCRAERLDLHGIVEASGRAGSLAIPLVKALTENVAAVDAAAARHVHVGSTSQDVIDTGMVLNTRQALALLDADLGRLTDSLLDLADAHIDTPMLARTLMQPAQVISFGFKLVAWIAPLVRTRQRLHEAAKRALQLQFGGAVGNLAVLGEKGPAVAGRLGALLGLPVPAGAWHTQRDEWVALACEVGILCGALGKIGRDIALLSQGEIGEASEPSGAGRGGSSAMPHKRNPVAAMVAIAAATRAPHRVSALLAAMPQEHERGLGNWQSELAEWAGLFITAHGSVKALADACAGLVVDPARMKLNIDALHGLVFAEAAAGLLATVLGKSGAHKQVEGLSQRVVAEQRPLQALMLEAVAADPALSEKITPEQVGQVFALGEAVVPARRMAERQLPGLRHMARAADR
ncbi:MAG: pcaB [Rhizobacter sp.]|nr:pcaB [Rhizobacter sp.]